MVSIDSRNGFLKQLESDPNANVMVAFVFGRDISQLSTNGRLADRIVDAIAKTDSDVFRKIVDELNERRIDTSSDWINDDYLLLALVIGSRTFDYGKDLCKNVLRNQRVTDRHSKKFHKVLEQFASGSNAVDGEYSFAKLVFRELVEPAELELEDARTVYRELTSIGELEELPTLPRLLVLKAFDLIVEKSVKRKLDSSSKIASEIQSRADDFSIGDWFKILLAMKPKILWALGVGLVALVGAAFGAGTFFSSATDSTTPPAKQVDQLIDNSSQKLR